jgi:predicted dienelactone hydrolase
MFDTDSTFDSSLDPNQNLFSCGSDSGYGLDTNNLSGEQATLIPSSDFTYNDNDSFNKSVSQDNSNNDTSNNQLDPLTGKAIAGTEDDLMSTTNTNTTSGIQLPNLTGPYQVGTTDYDWVDPTRDETYTEDPTDKREVTVKVWYPSETIEEEKTSPYLNDEQIKILAANQDDDLSEEDITNLVKSTQTNSVADAPIAKTQSDYPVLIFSPGFGGIPEYNTSLAEQLASQGYVVASINHPYDANATVFSDGRTAQTSPKFDNPDEQVFEQAIDESLDIRAADARFVLDKLESLDNSDSQGIFTQNLDLERVGILGHSLGGATAAEVLSQDSRFDAGLNMDGTLHQASENSLNQPFMLINREDSGLSVDPSRQTIYNNLQNDGYSINIKGTEHLSFTDLTLFPNLNDSIGVGDPKNSDSTNTTEPIDPNRGAEITSNYTAAFFDKYLNNQESPLLNGASPDYPEVTFESRQGKSSNVS